MIIYNKLFLITGNRKFLPPTYRCDEAWNKRLEHEPIKNIKAGKNNITLYH